MLLAISAICAISTIAWLTVGGLGIVRLTINWLGVLGLAVNGLSAVSTVGGLTVYRLGVDRLAVDRLAIARLSINGLSVAWLSVDRLAVARGAVGRWLSVDGLAVDGLHAIGRWRSVGRCRLNMRGCKAVLSLSLGPSHLTKEANGALLLGSAIIETTNKAEVHGLEQRMVVNIGTLTPFLALDVLLGRRPVVVGDWFVIMGIFLLLLTILIGLGKGSIDALSESFISDTFRNCRIIATSKFGTGINCESTVHFCSSIFESIRDTVTFATILYSDTITQNISDIELRFGNVGCLVNVVSSLVLNFLLNS